MLFSLHAEYEVALQESGPIETSV